MKPIQLTISGLQSYREPQTVDFARLTEAGVFGIFGPTGSGKSTILDAITLAMYGSVERAGNSIQGIMNAQEDSLSVSFAFQLAEGASRRTYRAERTYRRKPDGNVEQRVSRLLEETSDGTVVIADKAGEVNAAVEALIGLSMTDFTRAVVLPQGKFSEFLSLKGKERREMLQRLFRLERYGDELAARLVGRLRRAEATMREAAAELAGLGDASPEAVAAAEAALAAAAAEEARLREALAAAETAHRDAARLREALAEAAALEAERAALEARRAETERLEAALATASFAEALLPVWADREAAEARSARLAAEAESAAASRVAAEATDRRAREALAAAQRTLQEREAPTAVRLEQLRRAVALEAKTREEEAALGERRAAEARLGQERETTASTLAEKQRRRTEATALQAGLKAQLAAAEIGGDERRRFAAADRDRSKAAGLAEQAASQRQEAADRTAEAARRAAGAARREEDAKTAAARLEAAQGLLRQGAAMLAGTEAALVRLERQLPERIAEAKRAASGGEWHAWSVALADKLEPGAPCPVCGSAHHPAPAAPLPATETDDAAAKLETLLDDARTFASTVRSASGQTAGALHRLEAALGDAASTAAEETAAASAEEEAPDAADAWTEAFVKRRRAAERVIASLHPVLGELPTLLASLEKARSEAREERAAHAAAVQVSAAAAAKAETAAKSASEALASWSETYPEWSFETFEAALQSMERQDKQAEELRSRLAKSETFFADNAAELERLQEQLSDCEKKYATLSAETAAAERELAAKRADLAAIVGGETEGPSALSARLESELEGWRAAERDTRLAAESARAAAEAAGRRLAAAEEAQRGAREAFDAAERRWADALGASAFASFEAVQQAALPAEERASLQQTVERFKEAVTSCAAKLAAVRERLGGKTLSEEAWMSLERSLAEAKAARESALEARAKAEREAESLRGKHEQWTRLTREHDEAAALQQQLAKLQTVFRGNAFVEFLAEEQLLGVTRAASERLAQLTRGRYAIELDSTGGFVIRDDANGGVRRSVSTLSGGETFLTSLALALALSAQIQLSGKYPLEFFFLDEGFGTLDPELLDNVVTALERLVIERLAVGVISHVPELQARLPRKLVVTPADPMGAGSRVRIETL
ncbi:SMC family ATPase [Paenibacillus sp. TRM 82003]|nr:SMC family ATPase [Paenibacillus sp. TRM 82003]